MKTLRDTVATIDWVSDDVPYFRRHDALIAHDREFCGTEAHFLVRGAVNVGGGRKCKAVYYIVWRTVVVEIFYISRLLPAEGDSWTQFKRLTVSWINEEDCGLVCLEVDLSLRSTRVLSHVISLAVSIDAL